MEIAELLLMISIFLMTGGYIAFAEIKHRKAVREIQNERQYSRTYSRRMPAPRRKLKIEDVGIIRFINQ